MFAYAALSKAALLHELPGLPWWQALFAPFAHSYCLLSPDMPSSRAALLAQQPNMPCQPLAASGACLCRHVLVASPADHSCLQRHHAGAPCAVCPPWHQVSAAGTLLVTAQAFQVSHALLACDQPPSAGGAKLVIQNTVPAMEAALYFASMNVARAGCCVGSCVGVCPASQQNLSGICCASQQY